MGYLKTGRNGGDAGRGGNSSLLGQIIYACRCYYPHFACESLEAQRG